MTREDRSLVVAAVEQAVDRSWMTRAQVARAAGVSRATLYRVMAGDPVVEQRTLRRLEAALSLPYDTLTYVSVHDWQTLGELDLPSGLGAWLERQGGAQ